MQDFEQIQHDKANELTDRIMSKIGELFLKSQIGTPGDSAFSFTSPSDDPRSEIRQVIYWWMTEEREEKENG